MLDVRQSTRTDSYNILIELGMHDLIAYRTKCYINKQIDSDLPLTFVYKLYMDGITTGKLVENRKSLRYKLKFTNTENYFRPIAV